MTQSGERALLPAGFQDALPPGAAQEAAAVERLIACFAAHGYERVKPPLLEFEETLLSGAGAAVAQRTFRLMDPISQRMMALRADITPQVARVAGTRLAGAARPLRLCYAGEVLRVRGSQLRPERQFVQVGAELIGVTDERADAEVVLMAVEALSAVGIANLSVDLNLPPLVDAVARSLGLAADRLVELRLALDRKDAAAVGAVAEGCAGPFQALLRAGGPAARAMAALVQVEMPEAARAEVARLGRVVDLIRAEAPDLGLTVDPVEHRGFEYQTGISFSLFARHGRGELGRGGRYSTAAYRPGDGPRESSTGFTLYMDSVQRALPAPAAPRRIYLPAACAPARARKLRGQGWMTVRSLENGAGTHAEIAAEARRLGCGHALIDDTIVELTG